MKPNIRIEQYQVAADTVSMGGIKWLTKYDVKVQFSDRDTAYAWKGRIEKMLQGMEQQPKERTAGCTLCGHCAATGERITAQRKPLTDEQIYDLYNEPRSDAEMVAFARAVEAAHGIGAKP